VSLSAAELESRAIAVTGVLAGDGELDVNILDLSVSPAALDFRIRAPAGRAGHEASFRYFEKYERGGTGWRLVEYVYLLSWQNGLGQFEYHWHPFRWSGDQPVFHVHCQSPGGARSHYRSHPYTLEEGRADLLRRYASGAPVNCIGLYPLDAA
jgi:hypothetical protein